MNGYGPARRWPRWTEGPGAGGAWKVHPDEFVVEERPLEPPTGAGEHQWFWIEKVGLSTDEVADRLARAADVPPVAVGYAGLKDRAARTTQAFTVMGGREVRELGPGVRVLARDRTRRRLRVGQLLGNRFTLRVWGGDAVRAAERLERLAVTGCPNYYGEQRVGGSAPDLGRALLLGRAGPGEHRARKFSLSAWQALLFNRVLATRGRARLGGDLVPTGDEARYREAGPGETAPPTGPLFGWSMPWPGGEAADLERRVLAEDGVPEGALPRGGELLRGTRRALWFAVVAELSPAPDGFWLRLELPAGAYATEVLEEVL